MTQQVEEQSIHKLKKHIIWQDGHSPEPCAIVLFGATGDLAQRKILPTLAHLIHDHPQPKKMCIIAFARRPLGDDGWRSMVLASLDKYMPDDDKLDDAAKEAFATATLFLSIEF